MSKSLSVGLGLLASATACSLSQREQHETLALASWPTPRACPVQPASGVGAAEQQAVLCAEAFVRRNGYTVAPPTNDTAQIASESIELAESFADLFQQRRGKLQPTAYGVCRGSGWRGYTVVFPYRPEGYRDGVAQAELRTGARAVTMDSAYRDLRVEHRTMALATVDEGLHGCRRLPNR